MLLKLFQLAFKTGGFISPRLAGLAAYNLWMTPRRFKTPVSEQTTLQSANLAFITVNNNNIATYRWGHSPSTSKATVLLVHGWAGRGTQPGCFIEPLIKAGYQVLSFDAPAHGKSSAKQTNLLEIADVIVALQGHYGVFDSMITHSLGGLCAVLAVKNGLKTNRIVSLCPPATTSGLFEKFVRTLQLNKKTRNNLIQRIETIYGKHILQKLSMTDLVKNITVPGFVIHDAQDNDIPWEEGQAVAYAWQNAPFKITSELGHRKILRDPEVIKATIEFLQQTSTK